MVGCGSAQVTGTVTVGVPRKKKEQKKEGALSRSLMAQIPSSKSVGVVESGLLAFGLAGQVSFRFAVCSALQCLECAILKLGWLFFARPLAVGSCSGRFSHSECRRADSEWERAPAR